VDKSGRAARLRDMPNLGPASEAMLVAAGIETPDDLDRLGAVASYRMAVEAGWRQPTLNLLWAIEGALLGIDWRELPPGRRADLLAELDE
jgi:DNA transformation protein